MLQAEQQYNRGQLSKIVVNARHWPLLDPAQADICRRPPSNTFYREIETAVAHNIVGGYACGAAGPSLGATSCRTTTPRAARSARSSIWRDEFDNVTLASGPFMSDPPGHEWTGLIMQSRLKTADCAPSCIPQGFGREHEHRLRPLEWSCIISPVHSWPGGLLPRHLGERAIPLEHLAW